MKSYFMLGWGGLANAKQGVSGGDKNRVQNFFFYQESRKGRASSKLQPSCFFTNLKKLKVLLKDS